MIDCNQNEARCDELVDKDWIASQLDVSPSTVANWVSDKSHPMPKGFKLGPGKCALRRWRRRTVERYISIVNGTHKRRVLNYKDCDVSNSKPHKLSFSIDELPCTGYHEYAGDQPDGECHELYRYFDVNGRLLYVGISKSVVDRMSRHKRQSSWYAHFAVLTVERFPTRRALVSAEEHAIIREKPAFNIVHNAHRDEGLNVA